jgi:ssDNA-binding Zn-finger/Zn-ribbon topoisomerase 1
MPLPFWRVEKIHITTDPSWGFKSVLLVTCPRCDNEMLLKRSWPRKNDYGTAGCPYCFKVNRIPNRRRYGPRPEV